MNLYFIVPPLGGFGTVVIVEPIIGVMLQASDSAQNLGTVSAIALKPKVHGVAELKHK